MTQSSKPTVRPDGSALAAGDLWYNPSVGMWWTYRSSLWVSRQIFEIHRSVNALTAASGHVDVGPIELSTSSYPSIYARHLFASFMVATTNTGTKYWNYSWNHISANDTHTQIVQANTSSFAAGIWVSAKTTLGTLYNSVAGDISCTYLELAKTSTPGNITGSFGISFQLVAP